jgi:hypothetical protein
MSENDLPQLSDEMKALREYVKTIGQPSIDEQILAELRAIRSLLEKHTPAYETKTDKRCGDLKTKDAMRAVAEASNNENQVVHK